MSLLHVGLDIGSTTAKAVVLDESDNVIHSMYRRHYADIKTVAGGMMDEIARQYGGADLTVSFAGSGALGMAEGMEVPFAQELVACSAAVTRYLRGVDVAIELGGEDAKLTFFDASGVDQRMNETCAGGTGAFIDQMAVLLGTDADGLNELAKHHNTIYPIASRCGVFAKTDIQPLLNDGASKADLAASIFQAIVNQTISGLACGRKIKGSVAFLGGPLHFLSELRRRFVETLALGEGEYILPKNPHLFVAIGAALLGKNADVWAMTAMRERADRFFSSYRPKSVNVLPALFMDEAAKEGFRARHSRCSVKRADLASYAGRAYLGVDVGSTTIKVTLIGSDGELLFSRYRTSNGGEPVNTVRECLAEMYGEMPRGVAIARSGVTGYGEKLVQAAFGMDIGEVETVAHARAAEFVQPGTDFVIDIGGQDMKCLGIRDGVIDRVFLNEACSSGCGSFLQTFAESLGMSAAEFARLAEDSLMPVDLGSRCTVFMNSRVRQAQKEGADVCDISAGLVYSIVRNALYKVLKIRSVDDLGEKIVVQGGAFKNDALLRAFELVTGHDVVRPEISELMGAFGAALLARDADRAAPDAGTSFIDRERLTSLRPETSAARCGGCGNKCILTRTKFGDGRIYISGNKCERGGGAVRERSKDAPDDLFAAKYARLFDAYEPLPQASAPRGEIGVPRALNMYEDYPFWFTFLTSLGFRVVLSSPLPEEHLGMDTIPSQTLCYPAKIVHRHVEDLLSRGVRRIFYPIVQREAEEFADAHKNFNCPVITGYPDIAYLNIDGLRDEDVAFISPSIAISLSKPDGKMSDRLADALSSLGVSRAEVRRAARAAAGEQEKFRSDVREMGAAALKKMKERGGIGIILAGHPYHLDPAVNHGIPDIITSYGVTVFTEDSVCGMASEIDMPDMYVVDQWVYHSRLYRAAAVAARHPDFKDVELIQMNSFGCGLDAISADQTADILKAGGKLHTLIKIDEGQNNGAVKIRIRSLLASVKKRRPSATKDERLAHHARSLGADRYDLDGRTILCPPLSTIHFRFLEAVMRAEGYDFRVLPEGGRDTVELALKYVNNDACYPAMVVIGQFLKALTSGEHDPNKTDLIYAQTGGACRASNYVPLLRRALDMAGFSHVRILAAHAQENSGAVPFDFSPKSVWRSGLGMICGDLLSKLLYATRPYEIERGSADAMCEKWSERMTRCVVNGGWSRFKRELAEMAADFDALPVSGESKPRVGIVGEILVKYHANANERLIETIESEGGEAVVPDLANFMLYCMFDTVIANTYTDGAFLKSIKSRIGIAAFEQIRNAARNALRGTRFGALHTIYEMSRKVDGLVSHLNQGGEGWLLSAEMVGLIESGVRNVICVQPFACLPNHITGKGVVKELKRRYPNANILPLDYDSSVSSVNQLNRIKLLMATAK